MHQNEIGLLFSHFLAAAWYSRDSDINQKAAKVPAVGWSYKAGAEAFDEMPFSCK